MNEKLNEAKQIEKIEKWTRQAELTGSFKSNLRQNKLIQQVACLFATSRHR